MPSTPARLPYFDNDGQPLAFAHRGGALSGSSQGLENSMVAFASAIDWGYRYLETDVHATADGEVLAFHDDTLDRTTDRTGTIADLPYSEVGEARIDGREPIPRMVDVLEEFGHARFNVDLKSDAVVEPMVRLIRRTNAHDRVCLASFSSRRLARARALLGPRVAYSMGTAGVTALRLMPARAAGRVGEVRASSASQVPVRSGRIEVVTPGFVGRAHACGQQVHVWTVDEPDEMHRLLDLGVDGLISDRIDHLRDVLVARGQWVEA